MNWPDETPPVGNLASWLNGYDAGARAQLESDAEFAAAFAGFQKRAYLIGLVTGASLAAGVAIVAHAWLAS